MYISLGFYFHCRILEENQFKTAENGFKNVENGFKNVENGFKNVENDVKKSRMDFKMLGMDVKTSKMDFPSPESRVSKINQFSKFNPSSSFYHSRRF